MLAVGRGPIPGGPVEIARRVIARFGLAVTKPGGGVAILCGQARLPAAHPCQLVGPGVLAILLGLGAVFGRHPAVVDRLGAVVRSLVLAGWGFRTFIWRLVGRMRGSVAGCSIEVDGGVIASFGFPVTLFGLAIPDVGGQVAVVPVQVALIDGSQGALGWIRAAAVLIWDGHAAPPPDEHASGCRRHGARMVFQGWPVAITIAAIATLFGEGRGSAWSECLTIDAIADKTRPAAQRIAALASVRGASLPPKSVFVVVHDESDDLDVRLAAVRAVGRSPGAINQLVRRFQPPAVREAAIAELSRIARSDLPAYLERRISDDIAAARSDPLGPQMANLGLSYGRDPRVLATARAVMADPRPEARSRAIAVLASIGEIDDVLQAAGDPQGEVRAQLAEMLGYFSLGRPVDVSALEGLAGDPDPGVAGKARAAMRRLGVKKLPTKHRPGPAGDGDAEWRDLLARLAAKILGDRELAADLTEEALETGWLGSAGTGEEAIAALESRLGLRLPPSYRSFLQTTNGWGPTSFAVDRLLAAHEVRRFAESEPEWVQAWSDNDEGPELRTAIQVSTVADGVCLLIPSDGRAEWETWFFANWIPGAQRHASFRCSWRTSCSGPRGPNSRVPASACSNGQSDARVPAAAGNLGGELGWV